MQRLLHPYLDGELDLVTSLEVEEHLRVCSACAESHANYLALREGLRDGALYYSSVRRLPQTRRPSIAVLTRRSWALAAALLLVALVGWNLTRVRAPLSADHLLAQEVVAGHIRSLMGTHLADVASTSQHTVKPWFSGKLDYSPPVQDLAAQGFPLIGGRLDYLDGRPVSALVYRHQKHLINLFVWPTKSAGDSPVSGIASQTIQGYQIRHWEGAGMTYWSVSDLNSAELSHFAQLVQAH